ncbi:cytochrome P450 [Nitrosospira sp. Nsp5]|uniref:Cytochrome P450 n=1 Tax=Nitrosospira multiformis TaxID=1231 RepID=A0ABY0TJV0_9PROT|nr:MULTISPECIES: cytochrome P450 [Nitrosospira]PTR10211.1 cytochrome P450 [Nitrosospira sp. Nsp5]SDQ95049.1 Cytochrome P450 [Nitrosospira multiformis]
MFQSLLDRFQWKGTDHLYSLPWLRNLLEYSADPDRVKEYLKGGNFTRSQLTRDMLSRFHLSHDSIVVSDDGHAQFLRSIFLQCVPAQERYPDIAKKLVDEVFMTGNSRELRLSSSLIPAVYLSMSSNLLGANVLESLREHIREIDFQPGTRPMHLDGVMYALGMQFPSFGPMRKIIDLIFFKSDHYTRKITVKLEKMMFEFATPKEGSWYAHLIELKQSGKISRAQFRGELTSILVSSYVLSAAMSSMLLCLAARPEYVDKIRDDETMAKHFVNEVLRLFPPFRQFGYEEKGIWEKSGRSKEEVTDFMVSVFGLHRNENVWEDPDDFRPQRFAAANSTKGCKFMPFGLGKRSCTGRVYSIGMLVEVLKYVCSEECNLHLTLPEDYVKDYVGLPLGTNGRLVSFPVDDRIYARRELIEKAIAV